eukprot:4931497-Amphidinium_carterae.1
MSLWRENLRVQRLLPRTSVKSVREVTRQEKDASLRQVVQGRRRNLSLRQFSTQGHDAYLTDSVRTFYLNRCSVCIHEALSLVKIARLLDLNLVASRLSPGQSKVTALELESFRASDEMLHAFGLSVSVGCALCEQSISNLAKITLFG